MTGDSEEASVAGTDDSEEAPVAGTDDSEEASVAGTDDSGDGSRLLTLLDIAAGTIGTALVIAAVLVGNETALVVGAHGVLLGSSTFVVKYGLALFTGEDLGADADIDQDTGWLIGKLENVLVLVLVLEGEFTALSIVFAAKSWVRRDDISSGNTTYYLAGTLLNFTYSVVVGLGTLWLVDAAL